MKILSELAKFSYSTPNYSEKERRLIIKQQNSEMIDNSNQDEIIRIVSALSFLQKTGLPFDKIIFVSNVEKLLNLAKRRYSTWMSIFRRLDFLMGKTQKQ